MAVHLKSFEDHRREMEANIDALEAQEALEKRKAQVAFRNSEIKKAHDLTAAHDAEDGIETKHWQKSQDHLKAHQLKMLQYELYQVESRKIKFENQRLLHRLEEIDGIEWFERNMLGLGLGDAADKEGSQHHLPTKEGSFAFLDRIRDLYQEGEPSRKRQVQDMMAELKEKAAVRKVAMKEKEIRKRKVSKGLESRIPYL